MKKVFAILAMASVAVLAFDSCQKENKKEEEPKVVKRLTSCGDQWDVYAINYGADGKVVNINRNEGERTWDFTYSGNTITVKYVKEGEDKGNLVFTVGSNGFVSSYVDEWSETRTMTYDANGYLTKIEKEGSVKSELTVNDGNYVAWTRKTDEGAWQPKLQSFKTDKNLGGIHPDYADKTDPARFWYEIGLFGKASANLLDEAVWEGSETSAVHTYEFDEDGYVISVSKQYGEEEPELYYYTWEIVK